MSDAEFNTGEPLGYLLTWTTYGSWLPGDERGWRKKRQPDMQSPNALSHESAACKMTEPEFRLSRVEQSTVEATIAKHCDIRGWTLHTVNARTNHVHVVVTAPAYSPEQVRDQFKAWCTRSLKPSHPDRTKFWTEGASRRYLNTEDNLEAAITYVKEAQDRKALDCE